MDITTRLIEESAGHGSEQQELASVLGQVFLTEAQKLNPEYQTLDDIPELRQSFISFMGENAFRALTAGDVQALTLDSNAVEPRRDLLSILSAAGFDLSDPELLERFQGTEEGQVVTSPIRLLAQGGKIIKPTLGLIGEKGPELALLAPGSEVLPLLN